MNSNLNAMGAQRLTARSQNDLAVAIGRLSSGLRINSAKDDAAGLAIADRLGAQVRGINQAARNANDAISLSQTADGALGAVAGSLQRMRELAVQSANATNSASDRAALQREVAQLIGEVDRVASQTQFNGVNLLDGSFTGSAYQVGADAGQTLLIAAIPTVRPGTLGLYQGFTVVEAPFGTYMNSTMPMSLSVPGATISLGMVALDASAVSNAINNARVPGLKTFAGPTNVAAAASTASASASGTATFTINGVPIALAGTSGAGALAGNRAVAVASINAQSAATGVVAVDTGTGVALKAGDGRNVTLVYSAGTFTGSTAADFGLAAVPISGGTVNADYIAPPGVTGSLALITGGAFTMPIVTTGTAVSAIDISTAGGAEGAIPALDRALASVASSRAALGASQNRLALTLESLATASMNLTGARSRSRDADFAMETANLSRAELLQKAGMAMLAQANQLPHHVLQLLR